jgi:hypothetical protein
VTRRALPPLGRDVFFLILGGSWGTFTVVTAGPWPLMLISAATMLGPGFLRLWLSGPGTVPSPGLPPPGPPEPPVSSSPGPSALVAEAEASP